jgi:hypothetical protein
LRRLAPICTLAFGLAGSALPLAAWPPAFTPPSCVGTAFADVDCSGPFDSWVEQLGRDHVSLGCGGGNYCPDTAVTRGQLALILERAMRGTDTWHPSQAIYVRTVIVNPVPGAPLASGANLLAALGSITGASATNRYLLKIEPGDFDLGPGELVAKPFVDIEGSGEGATRIIGHGADNSTHATLQGADDCEIRFLTIENHGGANVSQAIRNQDASPSFVHVTVRVSGNGAGVGMRNVDSAPRLLSTTIAVLPAPGHYSYGILSESPIAVIDPPSLTAVDSVIEARGTSYVYGVWSSNTSPSIRGGSVSAIGGGATGVYTSWLGSVRLEDVDILAETGYSSAVGVDNQGSGHPRLHNVRVRARGGATSYVAGIVTNGGDIEIEDSTILADSTGGSSTLGLDNEGTNAMIFRSTIRARGGNDPYGNYGLWNSSFPGGTIEIHGSVIEGAKASVLNLANKYILNVGNSQLIGPVDNQNGSTSTCVGAYDGNFQPLDATCSP